MLSSLGFGFVCLIFCTATIQSAEKSESGGLRLTLPPTGYAVVGEKMTVYLDNLILLEKPEPLGFQVSGNLSGTVDGKEARLFWTTTPNIKQVGLNRCEITVTRGDHVEKASMNWYVSPARVKTNRPVSLLIVGDSLTHATQYPNEIAKRLTASGVTRWKMFGLHRPPDAAPGVAHEGYGGWRWQTFVEHFEPNPDPDRSKLVRKGSLVGFRIPMSGLVAPIQLLLWSPTSRSVYQFN